MPTRTVTAGEDHIIVVLTPRQAVALRGFLTDWCFSRREFSGKVHARSFSTAVTKLIDACPYSVWTRFDFNWFYDHDEENYPDQWEDRQRHAEWFEEGDDL